MTSEEPSCRAVKCGVAGLILLIDVWMCGSLQEWVDSVLEHNRSVVRHLACVAISTDVSGRWCAGHSNSEGLQLQSFRIPGGLQATVQLPARYKAFPGIINGGIVSTIFDCHGA